MFLLTNWKGSFFDLLRTEIVQMWRGKIFFNLQSSDSGAFLMKKKQTKKLSTCAISCCENEPGARIVRRWRTLVYKLLLLQLAIVINSCYCYFTGGGWQLKTTHRLIANPISSAILTCLDSANFNNTRWNIPQILAETIVRSLNCVTMCTWCNYCSLARI